LVMKIANQSKYLKGFKDEWELAKHEIFTKFPLKPTGMIQIAQLLRHKSLEDIITEKEKMEREILE
jgi:hypothetical protein